MEKIDFIEGFVHIHSPSGGAGSGISKMITQNISDSYRKCQNVNYLLFPSQNLKSKTMIVEPYNFTLCYNQIISSSSMVATFSNQQTLNQIKKASDENLSSSNYFAPINNKLQRCFNSIFNPSLNSGATLQDICQNMCAMPQINQAFISQK